MTNRLRAIGFLLCGWAAGALGQAWVVYVPPEGDFRVVFPAPPARAAEAQGAVAFSARGESMTFTVVRRDPGQQPVGNAASDIQRRLRGDDNDRRVERFGEDDAGAEGEHVFVTGGTATIHRLFAAEGRYYELVVGMPREELRGARATARDFFGSFQVGTALAAAGALATVTPDVLCQDRSNAFSRTFCEYSTCLRSQHRGQPYCQKLLSFR